MARGTYVFFVAAFFLLPINLMAQGKAESGVLDARFVNFSEQRLALNGHWTLFKNQLLSPLACEQQRGEISLYPALWNNAGNDGQGVGTYYLKVIVPDSTSVLALEIPQLYNSYKLWVNHELVASAGTVGMTKEETLPQWIYQTTTFHLSKDTLSIVLQLANFHHHKGGAKESIYIGSPERIITHKLWAFGSNLAAVVLLFAMGAVFLVFYMLYRDKKVILFFALLCLTWSIRSAFSNLYPITYFFPDFSWDLQVRIEYLTLYNGVIWSVLFLHSLFHNIKKQVVMYLLVVINIFFVLFTLFTPPVVFTRWVEVYLAVAAIMIVYGAFIVVRALLNEQAGVYFLLTSLLLGALVFGYDVIAYGSAGYNLVFLHIGYIVIFMLVTVALLLHLGIIKGYSKHANVLTYNEMFRDSKTGEKRL